MINYRYFPSWILTYIIILCVILIFTQWQNNHSVSEQLQFVEIPGVRQPRSVRVLKTVKSHKENKVILLWTKFFGMSYSTDYYFFLEGNTTFAHYKCPVSSCIATNNRTFVERADAIVLHQPDFTINDLPRYRKPNQRWIFFNLESPKFLHTSSADMNSLYNWTMTFRSDSDIVVKYGEVYKLPFSEQEYKKNYLQNKTKEAVWFVSKCVTSSNRLDYVYSLSEYIEVDIYGGCGHKTCEPSQSMECYETVLKDYKFYLSFENSICKDYVTEKFFNILNYDIIPIVMGGADYASISPPNSYIHTKDYPNPKHLAEYLKLVGSSETLYNSYFKWKGKYKSYLYPWMCELCEKLHNNRTSSVVEDVSTWWNEDAGCKTWNEEKFVPINPDE